jgi:hypothetical protein
MSTSWRLWTRVTYFATQRDLRRLPKCPWPAIMRVQLHRKALLHSGFGCSARTGNETVPVAAPIAFASYSPNGLSIQVSGLS